MELQKYSTVLSSCRWYSKIPDIAAIEEITSNYGSSGVGTFQDAYWYCDFTFCNLDFTEPSELYNGSQEHKNK